MSSGPKVAGEGNMMKKMSLNSGLDVFLTLKVLL